MYIDKFILQNDSIIFCILFYKKKKYIWQMSLTNKPQNNYIFKIIK